MTTSAPFDAALESLRRVRYRPELSIDEAPAPQRLAPQAVAITAKFDGGQFDGGQLDRAGSAGLSGRCG
ncbi:MAG: DUF3000 family protein [Actinomycetota bacterium]